MIKLFTHTDLDGVGCAVLAKYVFGDAADITYCNYDDVDKNVSGFFTNADKTGYAGCYITDISVNNETVKVIENSHFNVCLLDHHATASWLNEKWWAKVSVANEKTGIKTSGTELLAKQLRADGFLNDQNFTACLIEFVNLVRDYDTWRWASIENGQNCKKVNDLLYLYGIDKFIEWCLDAINESSVFPLFSAVDIAVLNLEQKQIDEYIEKKDKQMFTASLCGKTCGVIFAEKYFSELGNRLCQMHPEIDFVAMIDMDGTISYRTVKDHIDLGKDVAALFGGGGHAKAAGSQFDKCKRLAFIKDIFS